MSQWLESYAEWDTGDQRAFSLAVLVVGFFLVLLCGMWVSGVVREIVRACRKPRPKPPTEEFAELKAILQRIQSAVVPADDNQPATEQDACKDSTS